MKRTKVNKSWFNPHFAIIFTAIALVSYITYTAYTRQQLSVDDASAQVFAITSLPTNLRTTSLDSTIKLEWTPVIDTRVAWQSITVKDQSGQIVGTKVVNPLVNVVDMNGLRTDESYSLTLQLISKANEISQGVTVNGRTALQLPMRNAIFYDNFNDGSHGPMDINYYDVRSFSDFGDTMGIPDTSVTMLSERHYHTQLIESQGDGGVHARARLPAKLSSNTLTFQFESDMPPVQDGPGQQNNSHGKWWVVAFSNKIVNAHGDFTHGASDPSLVSIDFSTYGKNSADHTGTNLPKIGVIANGQRREFVGIKPMITYPNIRMPITVTLSRSSAVMYINGEKVLEANNLGLPEINEGFWSVGHANYRSGFIDSYGNTPDQPTITNQLIHWDTIQFDSQTNSDYIPLIRTYQPDNCKGPVVFNMRAHQISNCNYLISRGKLSTDFAININDDLSKVRSAKILITGPRNQDVIIRANGAEITRFAPSNGKLHELSVNNLNAAQLSALKQGLNNINVSTSNYNDYRGVGAFQLEIVYNSPKTFNNPPLHSMPGILGLGTDQRFDKKNYPGNIARGVAYIYSSGGSEPVNYTARVITPNTPWFRIVSSTNGQVISAASGGRVTPIEYEIDFNKFTNPYGADTDKIMGQPGIIRIDGVGASNSHMIQMPVMISALAVDYEMQNRAATFYPINHYTPTLFTYNVAALPQGSEVYRKYFNGSNPSSPPSSPSSTPTHQHSASPSPILTPSLLPSPTSSQQPSAAHLQITAGGSTVNGIFPEILIQVFNGQWLSAARTMQISNGTADTQLQNYSSNEFITTPGISKVRINFVNDYCLWELNSDGSGRCQNDQDRNVRIKSLNLSGRTYPISGPNVFGQGIWTSARGCHSGNGATEWLLCNGYFELNI